MKFSGPVKNSLMQICANFQLSFINNGEEKQSHTDKGKYGHFNSTLIQNFKKESITLNTLFYTIFYADLKFYFNFQQIQCFCHLIFGVKSALLTGADACRRSRLAQLNCQRVTEPHWSGIFLCLIFEVGEGEFGMKKCSLNLFQFCSKSVMGLL